MCPLLNFCSFPTSHNKRGDLKFHGASAFFTERDCLQIVGEHILPMRPAMRLLVLLLTGVGSRVVSVEPAPGLPALLSQVAGVYKGAVLRMYNVELRFASHTQKPVTDQIRSVQF